MAKVTAVVAGGGIVGSSAAYRLARAGVQTILFDRDDLGTATAAGAGIIQPSSGRRLPDAFYGIQARAIGHYPELVEQLTEDGETETGYEVVGGLFVATTDNEAARLADVEQGARAKLAEGVPGIDRVTALSPFEARELFPALADVSGAIHFAGSARVEGRLMRTALQRAAEKRGARIVRTGLELHQDPAGTCHVVSGEGDTMRPDIIVVAAGAWSNSLGASIGLRLPVYPQRGQILHLEMPVETSRWPIISGFHSHYMLTFPDNRVVAGATREDSAGYDYRMTAAGVHEALSEALRIAPGLGIATLKEVRIGLRPASPDGLPLLGKVTGLTNVYVATGHGPSGLQLGPYSGAIIADIALGQQPAVDLTAFAPERFA